MINQLQRETWSKQLDIILESLWTTNTTTRVKVPLKTKYQSHDAAQETAGNARKVCSLNYNKKTLAFSVGHKFSRKTNMAQ